MLRGLHFFLFEKINAPSKIGESLVIAVALAIRIEQLAFIITSALCARACCLHISSDNFHI